MDSEDKLLIERAEHEILTSEILEKLSKIEYSDVNERLDIPSGNTFYSAVIGHAYYSIFYGAKAYLVSKGTKFSEQGQHSAVYYKFKKLVNAGELDKELMIIYEDAKIKAEILLSILEDEEEKRTRYTYKTIPQANKEPAEKSIENAKFFISHIKEFINRVSEK